MKINIIEDKKKKMIFELKEENNTFCNALKHELWNNKHVKVAGYDIAHPLIGVPKFTIETDGKESAKKALKKAAKDLKKTAKEFKTNFLKEIK